MDKHAVNCPGVTTHHVDELRYGQSKLDNDHIRDVWHGSRPLVVTSEQLLEEIILGVRVGLVVTKNCRHIIYFKFKSLILSVREDGYNMRVFIDGSDLFNTVQKEIPDCF